jgi:hypothetical protein
MSRRGPAWSNQRNSSAFSPAGTSQRLPNAPSPSNQGSFPPLAAQPNGSRPVNPVDNSQDRILHLLAGLTVRCACPTYDRPLRYTLRCVNIGHYYHAVDKDGPALPGRHSFNKRRRRYDRRHPEGRQGRVEPQRASQSSAFHRLDQH